jgi:mannosyltransferase
MSTDLGEATAPPSQPPIVTTVPPEPRPGLAPAVVAAMVVAVALGVGFRFWTRSHLWLDEALTVNIAKLPLRQLPAALRRDGAPPLYYVLLHLWMRVFGTSAEAARALGGLFAVATIPVMWVAGRRLGTDEDRQTPGLVAVLLLVSSPFAVHFATEARMYSLVIFLTVLGFLSLSRILERARPARSDLVAFGLIAGLLALTHYWSLYLLAVLGALLLWKAWRAPADERHRYLAALGAMAAGGILFIPWLPSFVYQSLHTGTPWAVPASFSAMVNAVSEFAGGPSSSGRALGLTFFALAGFGVFGVAIDRTRVEIDLRTRPRGRGLAFAVGGTLIVAITIGLLTGAAFAARYTSVVFVPFLLLATIGTSVLADRRVLAGVVGTAVVFGLITSTSFVLTDRTQAGELSARLRSTLKPGDVIGYCPDQLGPAMSRLLPADVPQITYPRGTGPQFVNWVDYASHNKAGDPGAFAKLLDQRAGPSHTVWLVWAAQYRTFGSSCEQIVSQLTALRPHPNQLIEADTLHFFEHANLVRFSPR